MKRREFIKVTGTGVGRAAAGRRRARHRPVDRPRLKWRLTASWPKSLDTLHRRLPRSCAKVRFGEATDGKFQIQTFAAGEIVPGLQALDAVQNAHRRDGPHRGPDDYIGKDPTWVAVRLVDAVRAQYPPAEQAWYYERRRHGSSSMSSARSYNACRPPGRQHRLPDGRLVPQGDQASQSTTCSGLKMPHRRLGRAGLLQKLGCVPQQLAARRHLSRAGEGHHRRAPSGSAPMTTRNSASRKVAPHYYYPGWWEGGLDADHLHRSISTSGMHCRNTTNPCSNRRATTPTTG